MILVNRGNLNISPLNSYFYEYQIENIFGCGNDINDSGNFMRKICKINRGCMERNIKYLASGVQTMHGEINHNPMAIHDGINKLHDVI